MIMIMICWKGEVMRKDCIGYLSLVMYSSYCLSLRYILIYMNIARNVLQRYIRTVII